MCVRLGGLLLAKDATLNPPTHTRFFQLSLQLARSQVKGQPFLTSTQMSNQCLPLVLRRPVNHRLPWLCACWDTGAAVISRHYRLLNSNGFLMEGTIGFLMHTSTSDHWTHTSGGSGVAIPGQNSF